MTTCHLVLQTFQLHYSLYNDSSKPEESNHCKGLPEMEKETGYSVDMRVSTNRNNQGYLRSELLGTELETLKIKYYFKE